MRAAAASNFAFITLHLKYQGEKNNNKLNCLILFIDDIVFMQVMVL